MRVQVNLSDEMVGKIDEFAKKVGVSRSAFCSMLIGQGCLSYEKAFDIANNMSDVLRDTLKTSLKDIEKK